MHRRRCGPGLVEQLAGIALRKYCRGPGEPSLGAKADRVPSGPPRTTRRAALGKVWREYVGIEPTADHRPAIGFEVRGRHQSSVYPRCRAHYPAGLPPCQTVPSRTCPAVASQARLGPHRWRRAIRKNWKSEGGRLLRRDCCLLSQHLQCFCPAYQLVQHNRGGLGRGFRGGKDAVLHILPGERDRHGLR